MSGENAQVVRLALDAINRRNVDAFLEYVDPGIVTDWSRAVGPERGVFRGSEELVGFLRSWWSAFEESEMIVDELIQKGDRVMVAFHGRQRGSASGAVVEGRGSFLVWGFSGDSVTSVTLYQHRPEALDALGMENEHLRAAGRHDRTADFWESEGRADKAQTERERARAERRSAEARERQGMQDRDA